MFLFPISDYLDRFCNQFDEVSQSDFNVTETLNWFKQVETSFEEDVLERTARLHLNWALDNIDSL